MNDILKCIPVIIVGILTITAIDTFGAIASRLLHFKYVLLIVVSLSVYVFTGYYASKNINLSLALFTNIIIGFYDATAGWFICKKLKANTGLTAEQMEQISVTHNLRIMLVFSVVTALLGYWIS